MRWWRSSGVITFALLCAGSAWWWGTVREAFLTDVYLTIDGTEVRLSETGRGPIVVLVAEGRSALVNALAVRHRVIVAAPALVRERGYRVLAAGLDRMGVGPETIVVADAQSASSWLNDANWTDRGAQRILAVDVDKGAAKSVNMDGFIATGQAQVFVVAAPSSATWIRSRGVRPQHGQPVILIQDCDDGLTSACASEISAWIEMLRQDSPAPGLGEELHDSMRSSGDAPPMVVIPSGQFRAHRSDESPGILTAALERSVRVSRRLAVARTETSVAEFRRFASATHYLVEKGCWYHTVDQEWNLDARAAWDAPVFEQTDAHPVTCVTFDDAQAYAAWMTRETGHSYRLPTEDEFEFFNRAGRVGAYGVDALSPTQLCARTNGADQSSRLAYANECADGYPATAPVGSFDPNDFGLHDTTGNVWELTLDCWRSDYLRSLWSLFTPGARDGSVAYGGACESEHVVRGGAFLSSPGNLRAAHRDREGYRSSRIGFRLVREVRPPA